MEGTVELFPNPACDFFTIQFLKESKNNTFMIEVYTMDGKLIKTGEPGKYNIHISDLKSGNYLVKVTQDSKIWSTKLLKC